KIERPEFSLGTKKIRKGILKNQKAFTVIGGGDTLSVFKGRLPQRNNLFFSTGGGATLAYLAGQNLPGVSALMVK
ncbi:MAG TPA: phosphoglycerate kinase, partial [Candidatus Paceibacterota bacterium]|nr:phosphoglycerate kinase [Candidatus Paceibacterota bacterium]